MTRPDRDSLDGRRVLILEDEFFLADDLRKELEALGAMVIGPFSTVSKAETAAGSEKLDCAVLDLNLQGDFSFTLSRALREERVPVVFVSGYDAFAIPADLADIPHLTKPVNMKALLGTIAKICTVAPTPHAEAAGKER